MDRKREAASHLSTPVVAEVDVITSDVFQHKRSTREYFTIDGMAPTTLGVLFLMSLGALKIKTHLQVLPSLMFIYANVELICSKV